MTDKNVDNEDQPHAINHYLGKKVTGQTIVEALT